MGIGDYICVTLRGGAPWGFRLREGQGDTYRPFLISQIDEGGRAFLAGVREGDEVVSLNGEPCADLTLLRAFALIDASIDCLQLLLKRYCSSPTDEYESEETHCGERDSSGEALESTTLHIFSSGDRSQSPRELIISESHDEAYYGALDSKFSKMPQLLCTQLHAPSLGDGRNREPVLTENDEEIQRCFSPGDMVELQVSLSEQTLDDTGCTSLGSARGIQGEVSNIEAAEAVHSITTSHSEPCSVRKPLSQHGVVLSSPSMLGQLEVILQHPEASESGRGILSVGGPQLTGTAGSESKVQEEGGHCKGVPGSFTVSFGIPSEEATPAEEQDSDSEEEQDKPNKHRARHARLRRSESLSEKQVKEAKSKCKHIALLLTAAPSNPKNKGALMFKKHRQRAKKYTLVSYGTGEDEPEYSDEEDEETNDGKQAGHTIEFTLLSPNCSDKHFLTNAHSSKGVLTINWDKGLLEIERNLNNQAEMECLPETKGKGALMFAQRRLRIDEISAEHEELRRQGIPVEAVQETEKKAVEQSYVQSTTKSQAYMDVNIHQQSQQQQYQQYQEQYYGQQQNYQQQQQQQQEQQQQEQQQYLQQYQQHEQQQMYQQQQQEYHQEQQQVQHYAANINGTVQHHTSEIQTSFGNRTAKPFSVENMAATPYSSAMSGTNQDSVGQGEQIASRDERISTPAIKTGLLTDARKKITGKPMFTFKEAPKISPNPELLNLLNRSDKKLGFESGPEEDYLSLGAEACNFLQSQRFKHKTPPPVAPKPVINPNSPPWSPQTEMTNQDMPQCAENSVSTPAVAPTTETTPAPELEPTPAPAPEPSSLPPTQEVPASSTTEQQQAWTLPEPHSQQLPQQVTAHEENGHMSSTLQPESAPVTTWGAAQTQAQQQPSTNSWHPAEVQPHKPLLRQSPSQPSWVTQQPSQTQPPPSTSTWTPQIQPSWSQPQEESQPQPQVQSSWTHSHEQPPLQQTWGQSQDPVQQPSQASWTQPSETGPQQQPPWVQQSHAQPSWVRPIQPETQQQPLVQQAQPQAPQQSWLQSQAPGQTQPPWVSTPAQQQPSISTWPPSQSHLQAQPPWMPAAQAQPQVQPQANLSPWAPVPAQTQPQASWAQYPPAHSQHSMNSWAQEQSPAPHQPPWAKPVPPQPTPQPNWQPSVSKTLQQPPVNTWAPAQTQPQTPVNVWAQQPQQTPINVSTSMVNTRPSPKPWNPPQNRTPPPPPQRLHSFNIGQRASSPINPMATVLNPSSSGSAYEMPAVRGKGADMFAKRQSRMEKYIVDSETVQANKASRSTSPAASLPCEWKYTPNVRAPPTRAYNPIQSPFYPPAATKQPLPGSPASKAKKKGKDKQTPAPKPLNVIDVMKHQPYQLSSSLFTYGPAVEAPKPPEPKPQSLPSNPPVENQPFRYEQMAPVQAAGQFNTPYPPQAYGMPMQPMMHDGSYQQAPASIYPPSNVYQQPPAGPYQQAYNQHYQQPAPPSYQPQAPQSPNPPYQQSLQSPYQPASSPPYLAAPSIPYPSQPSSIYVAPGLSLAARPESASGGNTGAAPKPKFTAKKSTAQALGRSYSLSPPARVPFTGHKSASASLSRRPPAQTSTSHTAKQTPRLEKGQKPPTPWQAASRHPLGLVDEAFGFQNLQQSLASNIRLAAQRKMLPEPPEEWKERVSYQGQQRAGSQTWSQIQSRGRSRAPLPSFMSPTKSSASTCVGHAGYRSLPRQWQPHKAVTEANLGPSVSSPEHRRPLGEQSFKSVYSSKTWSWRQ